MLNAGAAPLARPVHRHTWQTFSRNWEVDVQHAFHWTREALLHPLDPGSTVIAVSSGAALRGSPISGGYAGAKATIRFLTAYAGEESRREGLGIRFISVRPSVPELREIRLDAGLTARALAQLTGWHFTKVSKLEHGTRRPSPDDIRAWCRYCQAEDQVIDLIATTRGIDAMYTEWRRQLRTGMRYVQDSVRPLYEQTLLFRVYETTFIPGLLNTAGCAAAIMGFWAGLMSLPADIETAVAARMSRQNVLYAGKRSFVFVIEEQALRTRVGGAEVMAGQLDRLWR